LSFEVPEVVEVGVVDVGLIALAHADEVRRHAAGERLDVRDDVAPEVGRRRVAVQEEHVLALANVDVVHLRTEHLGELRLEGKGGGDLV